ncbi:hypothetical protein PUR71_02310 [Streptomyces sp. SP17BM10]|uniref:hypothetical protein n=1 Tax=Streptomyces sp. SP17BM10 TaxID=3002530 RepID=UPI002E771D08|nr:hypothetical protein [Streptomyces sp. SP17BM10]MEE1781770.1 hypothetical protein [Streptomyces sp. SP17BM10]
MGNRTGGRAAATEQRWESLPEGIRQQVDGYVLQDSPMRAVRVVWTAGRALGWGLVDSQDIVAHRYEHLGDRIARTPDSPLDPESLALLATGAPGRIVAIEALWDGDTVHDWFVRLVAVTADPAGEHHLATVHHGTAVRFLGDAPAGRRHPSAAVAEQAGRALAGQLGVPFHFAAPDEPDDQAPRWRPPAGQRG